MRQTLISWAATSCFLILAVIALRAALGKRMGAGLRYALWGLVLVRLLVPVQLFTSPIVGTVIDSERIVTKETKTEREVLDALGGQDGPQSVATAAPYFPAAPAMPDPPSVPDAPDWRLIPAALGWAWLAGGAVTALVLLGCNLSFYFRLRRTRRPLDEQSPVPSGHPLLKKGAAHYRDVSVRPKAPFLKGAVTAQAVTGDSLPVYTADGLPSPCLFGVFRPAIYVAPETAADPAALRHVLAHEGTHASHGDHVWSLLRCAALCVHWWNPLVWLAAKLSRRDGELACDEGALKRLGDGERTAYGNTLLALVTGKPAPGGPLICSTAMTGDKKSLKERFARIARAPKRAAGIGLAAVVLAALVTVCAFGQKTSAPTPWEELSADLSLTVDEDRTVRITGTVDGMELPRGAFWYPPDYLFSDSPYGELSLVYPPFTDGIVGWFSAWWTDESRTAVNLSTESMAMLSSYWPSGYWEFTVDFSGGEAVVARMEAIADFPEGMEIQMHPKTISDEEAIRAGRIAARLLTAAEACYRDWGEKEGAPQLDEPLLYSGVTRVTGECEYPPFETFTLTGREANELLDCLSALELSDYETTAVPEGDGVTYTVETPGGSYSFGALKPYFLHDGSAYRLGMDNELFQVTDRIAASRTGTAEAVTDIPVPVDGSAPSEYVPGETPAPVLSEAPSSAPVYVRDAGDKPSDQLVLVYQGREKPFEALWYHFSASDTCEGTVADLNGDGRDELAVILHEGGGTGATMNHPHIFDAETLEEYDTGWYRDGFLPYISSTGDEENFYLSAPGLNRITIPKSGLVNGKAFDAIAFGTWVDYEIQNSRLVCYLAGFGNRIESVGGLDAVVELDLDPDTMSVSYGYRDFTFEPVEGFEPLPEAGNPASAPAVARAELKAALLGETDFILYRENGWGYTPYTVDITTAPPRAFESLSEEWEKYNSFAVVDLDGDGMEEVVYHVTDVAGDAGGYLILRWAGAGDIQCYKLTTWELKADGSFDSYLGGYGSARLSFSVPGVMYRAEPFLMATTDWETGDESFHIAGEAVTQEEFDAAWEEQHKKPDAVWYDFTPENVERALG